MVQPCSRRHAPAVVVVASQGLFGSPAVLHPPTHPPTLRHGWPLGVLAQGSRLLPSRISHSPSRLAVGSRMQEIEGWARIDESRRAWLARGERSGAHAAHARSQSSH